jgi:hypothetical protein
MTRRLLGRPDQRASLREDVEPRREDPLPAAGAGLLDAGRANFTPPSGVTGGEDKLVR